MIPKSVSATSLQAATQCLARYAAEYFNYARGEQGDAAKFGSTVHDALERYVRNCYIDAKQDPDLELLLDIWQMSYMRAYGAVDQKATEYKEGEEILRAWYGRTDFSLFKVISVEIKESYIFAVDGHDIPLNYIWDRFDQLNETTYRVTDYKTNRAPLTPDDLRDKIQSRVYALMAQIKFPEAERIWVEFDMLRHGGTVGVVYTRDENLATWKAIKALIRTILNTDEDKAPHTINADCKWCPIKATCPALTRNIAGGGIHSLDTSGLIDRRAALKDQADAVKAALTEIDKVLLNQAKEEDEISYESEAFQMKLTTRSTRAVDADMALMVIGPDLARQYGGVNLTMAAVDQLLNGDELTDQQKSQLRGLIQTRQSQPYIVTKAKPTFAK